MKTIFIALSALIFWASAIQAQDERKLGYFDAVFASGDVEIILTAGESARAAVYAEGMSPESVSIFIKGKTLRIQLLEGLLQSNKRAKVEISYEQLNSIKASAGAKVYVRDTLTGSQLYLRAASGALLEATVDVDNLKAFASEGGMLRLEGRAKTQEATATTGGQYQALSLDCARSYVKANTGGQAEVVANQFLDANANTGGTIQYKGEPEERYTRSIISGDIRKL